MTKTSHYFLLLLAAVSLAACTSTVVRKPAQADRPPAARPGTPPPPAGSVAVVKRGDTLYGIAFRNGLDVREVAAWNGIGPPYTIYPGQRLRLSPRAGARATPSTTAGATPRRAVSPGTSAGTGPRTPAATAGSPASATPRPTRPPATQGTTPPLPTPPAQPVASNFDWRWPAQGSLLNRFVAGEPTRQGIDIGGESGAPVQAAADGVVVYSGSGLVGYGELIIVKHNDAWLSAYGHNRARLVNEGAIVKAGQQIAVMGRTGAPREMLHFEIRHNGRPVDPMLYLPRR
ncbi:peptidoglycan DD-metalloendopeptidase family protein [Agrilutibacter solisilvae]|uniref:Peptidoglycan DD-metalloendopeptidase family protein n=1 Tax=Agrilutibacter solisilvae TaxID=2763317 RepID=A0A974XWA2_9GAMM|nr:peptidoglycan DD-metalloendopeptidase family protein [Lysobacter solisilvae]QSX77042.1 peptidoglycan DD-metalloendopeptidase family protein [Lysobacter solisilvae]